MWTSRRIGARPLVDIDFPAALREIATVALGIAHADFRLRAAFGTRLHLGATALHLIRHRPGVGHEKADMRDAETRLMAFLVAVEGLDRNVAVAIADVFVAVARLPMPMRMRLEHLPEAEHR